MKNVTRLLPFVVTALFACDTEFEPEIVGWKAYTVAYRREVHLTLDGVEKVLTLPGDEHVGYHRAQWTKENQLLLTQYTRGENCNFQIITADTAGVITDTVYTAPAQTALAFKLAPNDSLLVLKTYKYDCADDGKRFRYSFYDRFKKKALSDTIKSANALVIPFAETVWSPDSKKVILSEWSGRLVKAYVYDLQTKAKTEIDKGMHFTWSPTDQDIIAYVKDYSLYTKNIRTGATELVYPGKKKEAVDDFRWDPTGTFFKIYIRGYLLNLEAPMFNKLTFIYYSPINKSESTVYRREDRIDTWKATPRYE